MEEEKKDVKKQDSKESTGVKKETKKKFETAKGEEKNINNKIIMAVVAIAVLVVIAIVIIMFVMKDSPKKAIETMFGEIKSGNYSQTMLAGVFQQEDFNQDAQKLLFDKLQWKIQNVKEEGEKATVEVEITNKDFKTIINNYTQKILKVAFSGQNVNEEEMKNYLMEELNNEGVETVTVNQSIILEKKDGKWEPSEENDFVDILLPGFNEAVNAIM